MKIELFPTLIILWYLQFYIFTILYWFIDTIVQNNDNEISLHFKPMRLIFINYSV